MYVGDVNGQQCYISQFAPNASVCITGISGSGKTVRMQKIELDCVQNGATVIVFDLNQTHTESQIFAPIYEPYNLCVNRIEALKDGINLSFLTPMRGAQGEEESFVSLVNSAVNALTAGQNMGLQQVGVLRNAVMNAVKNRPHFQTDVEAIAYFLLQDDDARANAVYQRLWTVLNSGVLRPSEKAIQYGRINILDFSRLDALTKSTLVEIALSAIWRNTTVRGTEIKGTEFILALDEFQLLSWQKSAVMRDILREGRRFGIKVLMATQTLEIFPKDVVSMLNQMANRLVFRPPTSEICRLAKMIEPKKCEMWSEQLGSLHIGESIGLGDFAVGGQEVRHPIKLN